MNILFVTSEAEPFVKTGGLGDVASALPKALASLGQNISTLLPRYGSIPKEGLTATGIKVKAELGEKYEGEFLKLTLDDGRDIFFLDEPTLYGSRQNPYGNKDGDYADNDKRFIFFNIAVIEFAKCFAKVPDVIHLNDWQCGLVPLYLKLEQEKGHLKNTVSIFSIHNLAYQGLFPADSFTLTSLPKKQFNDDGVEQYGKLALLKSGIVFADGLSTVSKTYAKEILGKEFGFGLEPYLLKRKSSLKGIINGIDVDEWNPKTDKFLPANFSADDLSGKTLCRKTLLKEFGIDPLKPQPVVGMVSRLIEQKGCDIIEDSIDELIELDFYFLILGTGQKEYEEFFTELAKKYPDKVGVKIGYDNRLAHLMEGGADILLMPSRFEPCGLNQMYSLRYGTVPLVRATGGLNDTVKQWDKESGQGNGFVFDEPEAKELLASLGDALNSYQDETLWQKIMLNGMDRDSSWEKSAKEYLSFYDELTKKIGN